MTHKGKLKSGSLKDFDFVINPLEKWDLCSFAKSFEESEFTRKNCLYFYKEGLRNISNSPEFINDKQRNKAQELLFLIKDRKRKIQKC